MRRVRREPVAEKLRVDLGAARPCVLELLEDDHASRLAHHEPAAVGVERTARLLGLVVPPRQRAHRAEAGDPDRRDPRLGAAREDDVRAAEPDHVRRLADRHVRRGARGALRRQRPARPELHRDPGRAHVRDDLRDRERVHAIGAALEQDVVAVLERLEPADPGRDRRADALGLGLDVEPESSSAWRAAATIICAKRSMRRACLCSIHCFGSNSFSSQANVTGYSLASHCSIGAAPDLPGEQVVPRRLRRRCRAASPRPIPVTTTRRRPFCE